MTYSRACFEQSNEWLVNLFSDFLIGLPDADKPSYSDRQTSIDKHNTWDCIAECYYGVFALCFVLISSSFHHTEYFCLFMQFHLFHAISTCLFPASFLFLFANFFSNEFLYILYMCVCVFYFLLSFLINVLLFLLPFISTFLVRRFPFPFQSFHLTRCLCTRSSWSRDRTRFVQSRICSSSRDFKKEI